MVYRTHVVTVASRYNGSQGTINTYPLQADCCYCHYKLKKNFLRGLKNYICFRRISFTLGSVITGFNCSSLERQLICRGETANEVHERGKNGGATTYKTYRVLIFRHRRSAKKAGISMGKDVHVNFQRPQSWVQIFSFIRLSHVAWIETWACNCNCS